MLQICDTCNNDWIPSKLKIKGNVYFRLLRNYQKMLQRTRYWQSKMKNCNARRRKSEKH